MEAAAALCEHIRQKRVELCYPHSGQPPADDEIVRELATHIHKLPLDLKMVVLGNADSVSFAILQSEISMAGHRAIYCDQLSKLLHQSRLAQTLQGRATEAHETYERVLTARECILNSIKCGIFPLRTRFEIFKWNFAQDYGLMYTIERANQITVWKLRGDTIKNVWAREGVVDAVFSASGQHVAVSGSDGVLEVWEFADSPKLVTSVQLRGPNRLFTSATYLFATGTDGPTLWKWASSSSLAPMQLPDSLIPARVVAFSPETHRVVFSQGCDLWLANLPPQEEPPRVMPRDMAEPVFSLSWSANSRKIVAVSPRYIEFWNVDNIEAQPTRYDTKDDRYIASTAISPDGVFLAIGYSCELVEVPTLHVLDISQDCVTEVYHGYQERGTALAWFLDRHLAFAGEIIDIGEYIQREM